MAKTTLLPSQIVGELANLASTGTYQVNPQQSQRMNALFVVVAELINEMEGLEESRAQENEAALQSPREDVEADIQAALAFEDEGGAS